MNHKSTTVSLIAAIGNNMELGKGNKLLFHIPEDMAYFKEKTRGHAVIMGRKTYESIGHALPNRTNIVITRTPNSQLLNSNVKIANSIEEALRQAQGKQVEGSDEIFVIGGAQIYSLAMPYADKLYLTLVDAEVKDADAFFPDYSEFKNVQTIGEGESEGLKYKFLSLTKE